MYNDVGPIAFAILSVLVAALFPIKLFGDIFLSQQMMKAVEWGLTSCLVCALLCVPSLASPRSKVE